MLPCCSSCAVVNLAARKWAARPVKYHSVTKHRLKLIASAVGFHPMSESSGGLLSPRSSEWNDPHSLPLFPLYQYTSSSISYPITTASVCGGACGWTSVAGPFNYPHSGGQIAPVGSTGKILISIHCPAAGPGLGRYLAAPPAPLRRRGRRRRTAAYTHRTIPIKLNANIYILFIEQEHSLSSRYYRAFGAFRLRTPAPAPATAITAAAEHAPALLIVTVKRHFFIFPLSSRSGFFVVTPSLPPQTPGVCYVSRARNTLRKVIAGSKPLRIWDTHLQDGYVSRFLDPELKSAVMELRGSNVSTSYIVCPKGETVPRDTVPYPGDDTEEHKAILRIRSNSFRRDEYEAQISRVQLSERYANLLFLYSHASQPCGWMESSTMRFE
ncbi:Cilia- and flagella-associated protein 20 [Eumeta japonica]|uniref:Cilia-and flagella-associated protein 20 n=1 Tax=Eumeta variegata TaxID=151549 RepID=A0A4C1Z6K3_EUMVA|nr:Cilia- and flagella-associated protein 20 [Eumeta japonica]